MQAASHLFSLHGFRGTSLAAVAEAVDLTEPGLLHYFPNKENLLQNTLAYRDQQDEAKYLGLVQPGALTISEILDAMSDLVAENEKRPALIRLFTVLVGESIRADHPSHDYFVERYEKIRALFIEYLSSVDAFPSGVDLEVLATLIFAVMDGLQIQWLLNPEAVDMVAAFQLFTAVLGTYLEGALSD